MHGGGARAFTPLSTFTPCDQLCHSGASPLPSPCVVLLCPPAHRVCAHTGASRHGEEQHMHTTLALVSPEPAPPLATRYGSLREMRRVSVCVCVDVTQFHPLPWHRAEPAGSSAGEPFLPLRCTIVPRHQPADPVARRSARYIVVMAALVVVDDLLWEFPDELWTQFILHNVGAFDLVRLRRSCRAGRDSPRVQRRPHTR